MRVLLVNDHPPGPTGGAEVHLARLRHGLEAAGHRVGLFVPDTVHRGAGRLLDLWDPAARRRLQRRVASFRPDVVHYHNVVNELSTSVLGTGVPAVLTVHDARILGIRAGVDHGRSPRHPEMLARATKNQVASFRLRRGVHATIVPSRELAEAVRAAGFPRVHHVANFAPVQPETPPGREVLFLGMVAEHKGPHVLVEAFERIAPRHPDVTLRIVGDGPMLDELRRRVDRSGAPVRFDGRIPVDDIPSRLRAAGLVALPSLGVEGGGPTLAVVEAMCSGRGVVVTDRPGVREGVDRSVGRVVPAGDVGALADAISELLSDPGELSRCGSAARRRAIERWSPAAAVARIGSVYEEVVHGCR